MKLSCDMARDLLPLYIDEVCSEDSRAAVEAHLASCPACEALHRRMTSAVEEPPVPPKPEDSRFRKGMQKVRRRWKLSLAAVVLVFLFLPMQWNHMRGQGLSYSNAANVVYSWRFLSLLSGGEYGEAFDCLDHQRIWEELTTGSTSGAFLPCWSSPENYIPLTVDGELWYFYDGLLPDVYEAGDSLTGEEALELWSSGIPAHVPWDEDDIVYYYRGSYETWYLLPAAAVEELEARGEISAAIDGDGNVWRIWIEGEDGNCYWLGSAWYPIAEAAELRAGRDALSEKLFSEAVWSLECLPEWLWNQLQKERQAVLSAGADIIAGYDAWLTECRASFISAMEDWEAEHGRLQRFQYRIVNRTALGDDHAWEVQFDLWFAGDNESRGGIVLISREYGALAQGLTLGGSYSSPGRNYTVNDFVETLLGAATGETDEAP